MFAASLLMFSCTSKAEKSTSDVSELQLEDKNLPPIEFKKSEVSLPYNGNISAYNVRVDTLKRAEIVNADSYFGTEDVLLYILLPSKENVNLLLTPVKELGYARGYRLISIKNNRILSSLILEGEWTNPANARNTELTTCFVDEFYNIEVQRIVADSGLKKFFYKKYVISEDGFIIEEEGEKSDVDMTVCIDAPVQLKMPLNSKTLPNIEFQEFGCEQEIEGMDEYSCYDGLLYRTLSKQGNLAYLLVYSECGDSAFTDFVIVKDGRVVSGLTLDGSSEGYPTENTLYLVSFSIADKFSIELTEKIYEKEKLVSTQQSSYIINKNGDGFTKQK